MVSSSRVHRETSSKEQRLAGTARHIWEDVTTPARQTYGDQVSVKTLALMALLRACLEAPADWTADGVQASPSRKEMMEGWHRGSFPGQETLDPI